MFVFDHDMIVEKPQTNGNIEQVAGIPSNTSLIFIALTKITQLANQISFLWFLQQNNSPTPFTSQMAYCAAII